MSHWHAAHTGEGNQMTPRMMAGCTVAIIGFCLYSHAKMAAKPAGPPAGADVEVAKIGSEKEALLPILAPGKGGSPSKLARASSGERSSRGTIKAVRFDRSS